MESQGSTSQTNSLPACSHGPDHAQTKSQGQDEPPRETRRKKTKRNSRAHFLDEYELQQAMIATTQPKDIDQSHAYRSQILSEFLELMFPDPKLKNISSTLRLAFMRQIPNQDTSLPVLRHALDALCLAGMGLIHNDPHLVQQSRKRYGSVVHLLGSAIIRTTRTSNRNRAQQRSVLLAIVLIIVREFLDIEWAQATGSSRSWLVHIQGAERYLQACGPEVVTSEFDHLLFNNVRLMAFPRGIEQRDATIFAEPRWLKISQKSGSIALLDIGLQVASLLERCEMLSALRHSLEEEQQYLTDGGEDQGLSGKLRQLIADVLALRAGCEKRLASQKDSMVENSTMWQVSVPTILSFTSVLCAAYHVHLWSYMVLLDHILLRIAYFAPWKRLPQTPETIKADAITLAFNITRSMPNFIEGTSTPARIVGKNCNQVALAVFNLFGMEPEVEYCKSWDFGVDDVPPVHRLGGGFPVTEIDTYWERFFSTGKIYGQGRSQKEASCYSNASQLTSGRNDSSEHNQPSLAEILRQQQKSGPYSVSTLSDQSVQRDASGSLSVSSLSTSSVQRDAAVRGWLNGIRSPSCSGATREPNTPPDHTISYCVG